MATPGGPRIIIEGQQAASNSPQQQNRQRDSPRGRHRHQRGQRSSNHGQSYTQFQRDHALPSSSSNPLSLRPASVTTSISTTNSTSEVLQNLGTQAPPSVSNRRGHRRGRGNIHADTERAREVSGGRAFGGQLTRNGLEGDSRQETLVTSSLRGNAPNFAPNSAPTTMTHAVAHRSAPKRRRPSKSTAADLATRLHEDIDSKQYECAICTSEVLRSSKIWSCATCWTVFHLACIKQWASNSRKNAEGNAHNVSQEEQVWRCPGCNLPQDRKPSTYTCWCGKEHDPRPITGLPPHSCGQTCGKERSTPRSCPHRCELLCHAGPCSPCNHMGPKQSCFCGKESSQKKCVETDYTNGWSCDKLCGDEMPCGEHPCQRPCHEGLCGACEVRVDARCMCGAEHKAILCCDRDDDQMCKRSYFTSGGEHVEEEWTGRFRCGNVCRRIFDCGKHKCQKACHPSTTLQIQCPRSPEFVTHCPCGKTPLDSILPSPRRDCDDTIPSCKEQCMKQLLCGHYCQQLCHIGECLPCLQNIEIQCRCKRITVSSICHQGNPEPPQCTRVCRTTLSCGRHECGERCCPGERKAIERNSTRKKGRPLGAMPQRVTNEFEAEHICTRMCGRTLKCGSHACQELCHKGPCNSCKEAIFDEVACNCGRTVLQPPLPCGTRPPPCRYECQRAKPCGHPQVQHNCHGDDDACPNCPFLVEKLCICGKQRLKNQQCWFTDVRCGQICGKQLRCGRHICRKTCHRPGDCEDKNGKCEQPCGSLKKACNHPCEDQCHAPYPCKQDKPCPHKLLITCPCQAHKEEVRCGASATSEGNLKKELKCDEECARLERNRKLAVALEIDPATHTDQHIPYSANTLRSFSEMPKWCSEQERQFRVFASSEDEKRLRFKPMQANHRSFLHDLAEDYGLDSESMDPEPHRHVAVFKTPRFVSAPTKTLRDAWRIRQSQLREEGKEMIANAQAKADAEIKARNAMSGPYNGYLLKRARFALTEDELFAALAGAQSNTTTATPGPDSNLDFNIHFLPNEDIALLATFHLPPQENASQALEKSLTGSKPSYARALVSQFKLGESLHLTRFDDSLNVVRRENLDTGPAGGGWSQVAAKAAAPRPPPAVHSVGQKSGFAVLQTGLGALNAVNPKKTKSQEKRDKKKERKASVADDWEVELEKEEAALEKAVLGHHGSSTDMADDTREASEVLDECPFDGAPVDSSNTSSNTDVSGTRTNEEVTAVPAC